MGINSSSFLFSPNFDRYIDYTQTKKKFIIRNLNFESKQDGSKESDGNADIIEISTDIVSTKDYSEKPVKECIQFLASRMMFVCDKVIRIINEQGIDILLEIKKVFENGKESYELKVLSFTKVDNFQIKSKDLKPPVHEFREKTPIKLKEVFFRLLRKNQEQKVFQDQFKILKAPKKPEGADDTWLQKFLRFDKNYFREMK